MRIIHDPRFYVAKLLLLISSHPSPPKPWKYSRRCPSALIRSWRRRARHRLRPPPRPHIVPLFLTGSPRHSRHILPNVLRGSKSRASITTNSPATALANTPHPRRRRTPASRLPAKSKTTAFKAPTSSAPCENRDYRNTDTWRRYAHLPKCVNSASWMKPATVW